MGRSQVGLTALPHGERRKTTWPMARESLREIWDDGPRPQATTRQPCDWCGKKIPVGEPALALRVPTGGYSIRHQWCGQRTRRWRRRRAAA